MSLPFETFELPKEYLEAAYEALRMALEVKGVKRGTNETTKAVERGLAKLVYIALDVDPPEIVAHLPLLCKERKVPYIFVPSKKELGKQAGLDVAAASVAIVDPGEGERLIKEIIEYLKKEGHYQE
ncbi:50S ribosomal protein L7ae [Candidatus Geothermarchaeota archaeon]|nr:MAG: 50S ribosomal protein L7ae [Candidatus Geothermarchaeota archaeon]RLG63020.1 MAG: 50S ribosomal protein L7ae [Candidatus Geothermarchaeota archaeon]HEW93353.1 50S ribosomal protein L7ae [Thermoprotei archaeon]